MLTNFSSNIRYKYVGHLYYEEIHNIGLFTLMYKGKCVQVECTDIKFERRICPYYFINEPIFFLEKILYMYWNMGFKIYSLVLTSHQRITVFTDRFYEIF